MTALLMQQGRSDPACLSTFPPAPVVPSRIAYTVPFPRPLLA